MSNWVYLATPPDECDDAIIGELREDILRLREVKPAPLPTAKDYEREVKRLARNRKARERRQRERAAEVAVVEWLRNTFTTDAPDPDSRWFRDKPRGWWAWPVVAVARMIVSVKDELHRGEAWEQRNRKILLAALMLAVAVGLVV